MSSTLDASDGDDGREPPDALSDLVLVSNREPYRHRREDDGVEVDTPAGGLAVGVDPVMQRVQGTWIAWGDGDADFDVADDGRVAVPPGDPSYTLERLRLSEDDVRGYYDGYANQGLWPLCHSLPTRANFERSHWRTYREVNERFADAVLDHVDDDETVWFQDYHFALAPRVVREHTPEAFVMHFFHVPWPAPDVFRLCPQATSLLEGLLGNDLLGFHRPRYVAQFLECVDQLLDGATVDWSTSTVAFEGHTTRVEAFPFSVAADDIRETVRETADGEFWRTFRREHGIDADTDVAVGVDRLDYTKGIPERLDALEHLFVHRPDLRGEVTYVQKASPTRERVPEYRAYRTKVEDRIRDLNDRFGTDDWQPVVYTTEMYDRENLLSLYRHSDLALVTPLRDGMNLVAKEYVAAQVDDDGVLLLSPYAGAGEDLDGAVEVDPYDAEGGAAAIAAALGMDDDERRERMYGLRRQVHEHDLAAWLDDVLETVDELRSSTEARDESPSGDLSPVAGR